MSDFAPWRLGVFALIFAAACAQAPDAELDLASKRVDAARDAGAPLFAPEPFQRAESLLATSQLLASEKRYLEAIHHASDAVAHADAAFAEATMEKQIASRHVDRCLRELEGLMGIARSRGAPEKELAAFVARYRSVRSIAEGGDLLGALDQALRLKPELLAFEQRFRE